MLVTKHSRKVYVIEDDISWEHGKEESWTICCSCYKIGAPEEKLDPLLALSLIYNGLQQGKMIEICLELETACCTLHHNIYFLLHVWVYHIE